MTNDGPLKINKRQYPAGTLIQHRDGYVFIKTDKGRMVAHHRWVAAQKLARELKEGECVLRRKPDRLDNSWANLVVVQHALTKFEFLPESRVIYVPQERDKKGRVKRSRLWERPEL